MTPDELKKLVNDLQNAFAEFKSANDERLKQVESKGKSDPLLEEKVDKANTEISRLQGEINALNTRSNRVQIVNAKGEALSQDEIEHKKAFGAFMRKGRDENLSELETRAMSVGSDPDGGYYVPSDTSGRIVTRIFETSPLRQYAMVETIGTDALEGPEDRGEVGAGWVGETEARTDTTTPRVGVWKIPVHEMWAQPKATQKLLDDSQVDVEAWLAKKAADKFARLENYGFILGDGVKKPMGLFAYPTAATADATRAWGTFEYIKTGVNGGFHATLPADTLHDVIGSLKAGYRQGAVWLTNRQVVTAIRKFKSADSNNYLWQPGLQAGQPQTILGYGVAEMEDVPALATGSLSLGFGNVREAYTIVDRIGIRVLRDPFTNKPFVVFYTTKRVGGGALDFEAFKFVKFAA